MTARVLPSPILSMVGRPLHPPNCSTLDGSVRSYHTEKGRMSWDGLRSDVVNGGYSLAFLWKRNIETQKARQMHLVIIIDSKWLCSRLETSVTWSILKPPRTSKLFDFISVFLLLDELSTSWDNSMWTIRSTPFNKHHLHHNKFTWSLKQTPSLRGGPETQPEHGWVSSQYLGVV